MLLFCALAAAAFFSFTACSGLPDNSAGVTVKLIVLDIGSAKLYEKELSTKKSSLYEAFNEFEGLQVQTTSSLGGAWVNAVSVVAEDGFTVQAKIQEDFLQNRYIAVYHDIDDAALKDAYGANLAYLGKDYYFSGAGVSLLPLRDGATYILKLAAY